MCQVWYSSIQGISVQLGGQSAMGIYELFYTYRSAKFGVVVFKASMLDWLGGSICHGYMCIVLYIYIYILYIYIYIYIYIYYIYIDLPSLV